MGPLMGPLKLIANPQYCKYKYTILIIREEYAFFLLTATLVKYKNKRLWFCA